MKFLFSIFTSVVLVISQGLMSLQNNVSLSATPAEVEAQALVVNAPLTPPVSETFINEMPLIPAEVVSDVVFAVNVEQTPTYAFGNPAGCAEIVSADLTPNQMLVNVQSALGNSYDLTALRQLYIWNGPLGTYMDVTQDTYVYEFTFNNFQHPFTYRADPVVTTFLNNGFVVWLRVYASDFRLTAIPMISGVLNTAWSEYVTAYWQANGQPNDTSIYPVMKKLPCHWGVDAGYVTNETLQQMFRLDWQIPDYLSAGRQYLASTCVEANRISQEKIGYWDASSMCGPLAWTIMRDANGFPYRIGSWTANASIFTAANPRWNGQPWGMFDPETFTFMHTDTPIPGYDF